MVDAATMTAPAPTWLSWARDFVLARLFAILFLAYVCAVAEAGAVAIWLFEHASGNAISYTDVLFQSTSAVTQTGLVVLDTAVLCRRSQAAIIVLIILGGNVLLSVVPVIVRRFYLRRFNVGHAAAQAAAAAAAAARSAAAGAAAPGLLLAAGGNAVKTSRSASLADAADAFAARNDAAAAAAALANDVELVSGVRTKLAREREFEISVLTRLIWIVLGYVAFVQGFFFVVMLLFVRSDAYMLAAIAAEHPERGAMSVEWFAFFLTVSAFNNAGFSVLSSNLVAVCESGGVLTCLGVLVLLGNTLYPVAIRVLIVLLARLAPHDEVYRELLEHPRKYYTHMLSHKETLLIAAIVALFTFVEFFLFLGLDLDEPFLSGYSTASRVSIGWFQSISTRTAGFNALDLTQINPAMQVIYLLMMYVAAMPQIFVLNASAKTEAAAGKAAITTSRGIKVVLVPDPAGERARAPSARRTPSARPLRLGDVAVSGFGSPASAAGELASSVALSSSGMVADARALAGIVGTRDEETATSQQFVLLGGIGALDAVGLAEGNGAYEEEAERKEEAGEEEEEEEEEQQMELLLKEKPLKAQPVSAQAVNVLSEELPALFLALLAICIADGKSFQADPLQKLGVWPTLFELASAYGTVGLSLGYPGSMLSLSAFLGPFSRFVIIGVMLAGRMRKLPLSIDPAVRVKNVVELELQERERQAEERQRQAEARARELRASEAEAERLRRALGGGATPRLRADGNTQTHGRGRAVGADGARGMPQGWAMAAAGAGSAARRASGTRARSAASGDGGDGGGSGGNNGGGRVRYANAPSTPSPSDTGSAGGRFGEAAPGGAGEAGGEVAPSRVVSARGDDGTADSGFGIVA
jgi:Trk-type K+ transport system membrane component